MLYRVEALDPAGVWCGISWVAGDVMADLGLPRGWRRVKRFRPGLRWFFTALGWDRVGKHAVHEARRRGCTVRVVKVPEGMVSPVWRDRLQVAGFLRAKLR